LLRFDIVTAHLGTALVFFCTLVAIAVCLTPFQRTTTSSKLSELGIIASVLIYGQCLLGGLVGSRWAAHQCLSGSHLCTVMNSHLLGVLPTTLAVFALFFMARRTPALPPIIRTLAHVAGGLITLQIGLGVATLRLHLQVEPLTVAHHTIGAMLLGTLVAFTVLTIRDNRRYAA
jgi:cytochrome c oxidase assembly protein subunit 15